MQIYDTFIYGASYRAFGYALTRDNCLIAERGELCDTHFYAPLCCFHRTPYAPATALGTELDAAFQKLRLFDGDRQNVNGFESGLCSFLKTKRFHLLLKCRVLSQSKSEDGLWHIRFHTDSGMETVAAKHIYDTRPTAQMRFLSVLYTAPENFDHALLCARFPGSRFEAAFYPNRYCLYVPVENKSDLNRAKYEIYARWNAAIQDAKILLFAPAAGCFGEEGTASPVHALEKGIAAAHADTGLGGARA